MKKEQIRYVAVKSNGDICGPVGTSFEFVKTTLEIGHKSAGGSVPPGTDRWEYIKKLGYAIKKCRIIILEEGE